MPTPGERRALLFLAAVGALGVGARGCAELRSSGAEPAAADRAALARQIAAVDSVVTAGGVKRSRSGKAAPKVAPTRSRAPSRSGASAGSGAPARSGPSARTPRPSTAAPPREPPPFDPRALYRLRRQRADPPPAGAPRTPRAPRARSAVGAGRPAPRSAQRSTSAPVDLDTAPQAEIETLAGIGPALAARIVADRTVHGPFGSLEGLKRVPGVGAALARRLQSHVTFSLTPRLGGAVEPWPKARYKRPQER